MPSSVLASPSALFVGANELFFDVSTTQSAKVDDFRQAATVIANNMTATITWTADLAHAQAQRDLNAVLQLKSDWDSYAAPPPSEFATNIAKRLLDIVRKNYFAVPHIVASAEGGIAAAFTTNNRFGQVEILNTGAVLVTTFSDIRSPRVAEFGSDEHSLGGAIETVRNFLFE